MKERVYRIENNCTFERFFNRNEMAKKMPVTTSCLLIQKRKTNFMQLCNQKQLQTNRGIF